MNHVPSDRHQSHSFRTAHLRKPTNLYALLGVKYLWWGGRVWGRDPPLTVESILVSIPVSWYNDTLYHRNGSATGSGITISVILKTKRAKLLPSHVPSIFDLPWFLMKSRGGDGGTVKNWIEMVLRKVYAPKSRARELG